MFKKENFLLSSVQVWRGSTSSSSRRCCSFLKMINNNYRNHHNYHHRHRYSSKIQNRFNCWHPTSTSTRTTLIPQIYKMDNIISSSPSSSFSSFTRKASMYSPSSTRRMMKTVASTEDEKEQGSEGEGEGEGEVQDRDDLDLTTMIRKAYEDKETDGIIQMAEILKQKLLLSTSTSTCSEGGRKGYDKGEGMVFIEKALDAVDYNKGKAAGIINAFIASQGRQRSTTTSRTTSPTTATSATTSTCNDDIVHLDSDHLDSDVGPCSADPELAWDVYTAWEENADEFGFYPDLVTFCCTYTVMMDATRSGATISSNTIPSFHEEEDNNDVIDIDNDRDDEDKKEYYRECALQVLNKAERQSKKIAGSKRRKLLVALSRRRKKDYSNESNIFLPYDENDSYSGGNEDGGKTNLESMKEMYGEDFDVLFENKDCIVVSKPSGMVCFHSRKTSDGKIHKKKGKKKKTKKGRESSNNNQDNDEGDDNTSHMDISLEDALLDFGVPLSTLNPQGFGICHRIDRGTSGCIVLAKSNEAHARLVTNFFTRNVKKSYLALVPFHRTSSIGTKYDNDSTEELDTNLVKSGEISDTIGGRPALSKFTVVESYGTKALQLKIETKTGRKHQVRVHCAGSLGRPIFLDPIYSSSNTSNGNASINHVKTKGNRNNNKRKGEQIQQIHKDIEREEDSHVNTTRKINEMIGGQYPAGHRFFLHASTLAIDDFGINIDVASDFPQWWKGVLSKL